MTAAGMISAGIIAAWALLGLVAGLAHFATLHGNARLWLQGRLRPALALQVARLALTVALLVVAARQGAWPLLLAIAGFLAGRTVVMARLGRAAP